MTAPPDSAPRGRPLSLPQRRALHGTRCRYTAQDRRGVAKQMQQRGPWQWRRGQRLLRRQVTAAAQLAALNATAVSTEADVAMALSLAMRRQLVAAQRLVRAPFCPAVPHRPCVCGAAAAATARYNARGRASSLLTRTKRGMPRCSGLWRRRQVEQAQSGGQWAGGRTGAEKVVEHMLRMQLCLQHGDWRGAQMSVSEEEKWRAASQPRGWKELEDEFVKSQSLGVHAVQHTSSERHDHLTAAEMHRIK